MEEKDDFIVHCIRRFMTIGEIIIDGIGAVIILSVAYGVSEFGQIVGLEDTILMKVIEWVEYIVDILVFISFGTSTVSKLIKTYIYPAYDILNPRYKVLRIPNEDEEEKNQ